MTITISGKTAKQIRSESDLKSMRPGEYIQLLLDTYNLEHIDLIIARIKKAHTNLELNVVQRAQLGILKDYLDSFIK